jgi:hypothetical protein
MGWQTIGAEESAAILDVARDNLTAVLTSRRGKRQ